MASGKAANAARLVARRLNQRPSYAGLKRFALAMGPTGLALVAQLVAFALTARGLGVDTFGAYAALLALTAVGIELVGLGGADLLVRGVARDPTSFPGFFGHMLLSIIVTFPVVILLGVWAAGAGEHAHMSLQLVLAVMIGEILLGRVFASVELIMVAHRDTFRASCIRMINAGSRLLLATVYFTRFHSLSGWVELVAAQAVVLSATAIIVMIYMYGRPQWTFRWRDLRPGVAFAGNQTARAAQTSLDRVILARFADEASLGAYAAASRLLQVGLFPLQVVTRILYPHYFKHGEQGLKSTVRFALRSMPILVATGAAAAVAVSLAALLAPSILGRGFKGSTSTAIQLGFALPLLGAQYAAADALTGAGYQNIRAIIFMCCAVGFGFVLVAGARLGGTQGIIYAFLAGQAFLAILLWATVAVLLARERGKAVLA